MVPEKRLGDVRDGKSGVNGGETRRERGRGERARGEERVWGRARETEGKGETGGGEAEREREEKGERQGSGGGGAEGKGGEGWKDGERKRRNGEPGEEDVWWRLQGLIDLKASPTYPKSNRFQ